MNEPVIPPYATYAPTRLAGTWRMHETTGHVRNSIAQNTSRRTTWDNDGRMSHQRVCDILFVFAFRADGSWERFTPDQITKDWK